MLLTFLAVEIRAQIAHASASTAHHAVAGHASPALPALHLAKRGAAIYLASNGAPGSAAVAHALGFGPKDVPAGGAGALGDLADVAPGNFTEAISLDSFAKALAAGAEHVRVVLTRTYINVLGGQPERVPAPPRSRPRLRSA
jgi:hypothetical protein